MWLLLLKKNEDPEVRAAIMRATTGQEQPSADVLAAVAVMPSDDAWQRALPRTGGKFPAYLDWVMDETAMNGAPLFGGALVPAGSIGMATKQIIERMQAAGRRVMVVRVGLTSPYSPLEGVEKTTGRPQDGWRVW